MSNESDDMPMPSEAEDEQVRPRAIMTAAMILGIDWKTVLAPVAGEDDYAVERHLHAVAKDARDSDDETRADVLELFAAIMFIAVRPDDEQNPFGAKLVLDGRRSMIPDDVAGEQSAILAGIVDQIPNVHMRAKIGDIVFYNSRKHWKAAATAIEAYCEIACGRLDDRIAPRWPDLAYSILDVVEPLARAVALTRLTRKRADTPPAVRDALTSCYRGAFEGGHYVAFVKLAELGLWHRIFKPEVIAPEAETLAKGARDDAYPEAIKRVWLIAAECHDRLDAKDDANRCRMRASEQTLKMRDQSDQPSVKAHWTKAALGEMRQIPGSRDRVLQLRDELKGFQLAAHDEFATFFTPIDLTEARAGIEELFDGISYSDACLQFCVMAQAPSKQELRDIVLDLARKNPLGASMASSFYDSEGRETARVGAASWDEEPTEDWYRAEAIRCMDVAMLQQIRGKIEPARVSLAERVSIQERHLLPIVEASMFVAPAREALFALGFARMFQGDYATAAHLLFPQLENSLRHLLMVSNRDPTKIEQDLIQGDRTLSALLDSNRAELEKILGPNIVHEIDILFNFRPGPGLRNETAHGKMPWGAFFHHANIFGCWFIFGLTCRALVHVWREQIAPQLDAEVGDL